MNFQANVCLMYELKPITTNWQNHGHYLWPGTLLLIWSDCQPNAAILVRCILFLPWRPTWTLLGEQSEPRKDTGYVSNPKLREKGLFVHKLERNFDEKNMGFISIIRQQNSSWKNRDVCYKCYVGWNQQYCLRNITNFNNTFLQIIRVLFHHRCSPVFKDFELHVILLFLQGVAQEIATTTSTVAAVPNSFTRDSGKFSLFTLIFLFKLLHLLFCYKFLNSRLLFGVLPLSVIAVCTCTDTSTTFIF